MQKFIHIQLKTRENMSKSGRNFNYKANKTPRTLRVSLIKPHLSGGKKGRCMLFFHDSGSHGLYKSIITLYQLLNDNESAVFLRQSEIVNLFILFLQPCLASSCIIDSNSQNIKGRKLLGGGRRVSNSIMHHSLHN